MSKLFTGWIVPKRKCQAGFDMNSRMVEKHMQTRNAKTTRRDRADSNLIIKFRTGLPALGLLIAGSIACAGQTFQTLVNFDGANGANPDYMTLIQAANGSLYGTTYSGGLSGCGAVFKLTQAGAFTPLHSFNCTSADGGNPTVGLMLGFDRSLYGTTEGADTIFRITPTEALTTLLQGIGGPRGQLVQISSGWLYGTTVFGGGGAGSVYKVTPRGGGFTTIYSFPADGTQGMNPNNGLVQDAAGNFYGTTEYGAANNCGVIFKITPTDVPTTLHSFTGVDPDGCHPLGTLVQANDGSFYGVTPFGGQGYGTVFAIDAAGDYKTIYSFTGGSDGAEPRSGSLALANDGNLYGTTSVAGSNNCGTIFKTSLTGALTPLYAFDRANGDGCDAEGGLLQATNGVFYGTTYSGGTSGLGTVFSLNTGLRPLVKTVPAFGSASTPVMILGSNLLGATAVTFNGTPAASFTVVSRALITTTVPVGATSGIVKVTIPAGTLKTATNFIVNQ